MYLNPKVAYKGPSFSPLGLGTLCQYILREHLGPYSEYIKGLGLGFWVLKTIFWELLPVLTHLYSEKWDARL